MTVREYWVYQRRGVATPWALHIVKEFDRRYSEATIIDFTIFHEDIPLQTHSKSFAGLHCDDAEGYADAICKELSEFVEVNEQDYMQILSEMNWIIKKTV